MHEYESSLIHLLPEPVTRRVNHKFRNNTILQWFFAELYDICQYHKGCCDTISIRFDTAACEQYETKSYVYSTQSVTFISTPISPNPKCFHTADLFPKRRVNNILTVVILCLCLGCWPFSSGQETVTQTYNGNFKIKVYLNDDINRRCWIRHTSDLSEIVSYHVAL